MTQAFKADEILTLAASGVHKIDLMGVRGATLVSTNELHAMAIVIALSGGIETTRKLLEQATAQGDPNV